MKITLREFRSLVRRLVERDLEDEMNTLEVGDLVDTMGDEFGDFTGVRVVQLVDDVEQETGVPAAEGPAGTVDFRGPGFVGLTPEGDELVFTMDQIVPASKAKGYFPRLGDENDEDEYGRPVANPYRKMARQDAVASVSRHGDYIPE